MSQEQVFCCALFQGMKEKEAESILSCLSAVRRRYEKGNVIFSAGHCIRSLGLVQSGRVEIVRDDYWGNRQVLGTAGPGELFGEAYACIGGEPLMVSVLASEMSEILSVSGSFADEPVYHDHRCGGTCEPVDMLITWGSGPFGKR